MALTGGIVFSRLRGRRGLPALGGRGWISTLAADLPLVRSAIEFAERKHAGQTRADGAPFILHPLGVAWLLHERGAPEHLVAAGILHDVLEKTDATEPELRGRFGSRVGALVLAVSGDQRIGGELRREAGLDGHGNRRVRELPNRRLRNYQRSLAMLEERLPEAPLVAAFREELRMLLREPSVAAAS